LSIVQVLLLHSIFIFNVGEDSDFPISELMDSSPQSKGWQSGKFCEYPQEIII